MYRLSVWLFKAIRLLDLIRRKSELLFSILLTVPLSLLAIYLPNYVQFTDQVHIFGLAAVRDFHDQHLVYWTLSAAATTFLAERLVGHLVFPALTYLPWAVATRTLGFEAVTRNSDVTLDWTAMIVRRACEAKQRVRVICIGGKHLWSVVPPDVRSIEDAPLRLAKHTGLIDAVMPMSAADNPTVAFRYATYTDEFKSLANFREGPDLVHEMDDGKRSLLKYPDNRLYEHKILCMWRIVLTDEYCLTQNYFPNKGGGPSYRAPAFLFRKREPSGNVDTYYDVFEQMFELIKKSASERTSMPPVSDPSPYTGPHSPPPPPGTVLQAP